MQQTHEHYPEQDFLGLEYGAPFLVLIIGVYVALKFASRHYRRRTQRRGNDIQLP